jgi:hypothetical protein
MELNQSRYQNPLRDLSEDVNADGQISAIDALRIVNFLNRELGDTATSVPVSEIGDPPPNYYDANGDGQVSTGDALRVINALGRIVNSAQGESVGTLAASATTTGFVAGSTASLPVRNLEPVSAAVEEDPRDNVLAAGFEIESAATEQAVKAVSTDEAPQSSPNRVDEALSLVLDEFTLDGNLN